MNPEAINNIELLNKVFINSKRGEMAKSLNLKANSFKRIQKPVVSDKLFAVIINELIKNEKYNIAISEYCIYAIPKNMTIPYMVVTAHFDNVYKNSFYSLKEDILIGTLDNAIGVLAILDVINLIQRDDVIFAFTDGEETDCCGIKDVLKFIKYKIKQQPKVYMVLDVTNVKSLTSTTIENIFIKLPKIKNCIAVFEGIYEFEDEAMFLGEKGKPVFSVCCAINSPNDDCHSEKGSCLALSDYCEYVDNIIYMLKLIMEID